MSAAPGNGPKRQDSTGMVIPGEFPTLPGFAVCHDRHMQGGPRASTQASVYFGSGSSVEHAVKNCCFPVRGCNVGTLCVSGAAIGDIESHGDGCQLPNRPRYTASRLLCGIVRPSCCNSNRPEFLPTKSQADPRNARRFDLFIRSARAPTYFAFLH